MSKLSTIGHTESFKIRTHEIDLNKKLKIPSLLQLMQEASMSNAIQLNVSIWDLEDQALSWVLVKKKIKIYSLPGLGDKITVTTYPSGLEKLFAYRDFIVKDNKNNICAEASSSWILMNTKTRKLVKPDFSIPTPEDVTVLKRAAFNLKPSHNLINSKTFQINWFDLDWNNHVNNVFLMKCMIESLPVQMLQSREIDTINVQYKSEGLLNDELICSYREIEKRNTEHSILRKSDNKTIALAEIVYK